MVNIRGRLTIKNISGVVRNFAIGLSVKKQGTTNWIDYPWKKISNLAVNGTTTYDLTADYDLPIGTYDAKFGIWEGGIWGTKVEGDYYTGGTLVKRIFDHDLTGVFTITEAPPPPGETYTATIYASDKATEARLPNTRIEFWTRESYNVVGPLEQLIASGTTDSNGKLILELPEGMYSMKGYPPEPYIERSSHPWIHYMKPYPMELHPSFSVQEPPSPHTLTLTVSDWDTEKPVSGVNVTANGESKTTNSSGKVSFHNLMPGWYTVVLEKSGYETITDDVKMHNQDKSRLYDMKGGNGNGNGNGVPPAGKGRLRVTIRDATTNQLIEGMHVWIEQAASGYGKTHYTNSRGEAISDDLWAGELATYQANSGGYHGYAAGSRGSAGILSGLITEKTVKLNPQ